MQTTLIRNPHYRRSRRRHNPRLARNRFGQFMRRRSSHRRNPANPSYPFTGEVHVPEIYENPSRRRYHRRRRNPDGVDAALREVTFGVAGINEMAGLLTGAFASQMLPQLANQLLFKNQAGITGWADVLATGISAVLTGVGGWQVNSGFGKAAVSGGMVMALMKGVSQLTGGRFGLDSASPTLVRGATMRALPPVPLALSEAAKIVSTAGL